MYAVVEIQGKQYRAEKGAVLKVDLLEQEKGANVAFDSVLLVSDNGKVNVGTPYVSGASVKTTVTDHVKGDKVIVFKYKPKKDYRVTQGHRQNYTMLKVEDVVGA